jgi:hypothetical protein
VQSHSTLSKEYVMADSVKKRHRSPNYPVFDLGAAVAKAKGLFAEIKRHAVGADVVISNLGYTPKSSSGQKAIAALRSFGLLADQKDNADSTVRFSDTGLDIVADCDEGSTAWRTAVQAAALRPAIHKELWDRYSGEVPPDQELRRYLIRVREPNFNDNSVDDFIGEFKRTIAYAGLGQDDIIGEESTPEPGEGDREMPPTTANPVDSRSSGPLPKASGPASPEWAGPVVKLDLPRGNMVEIRLRKKVTPKEFESLKRIFDLSELSFVEDESQETRE